MPNTSSDFITNFLTLSTHNWDGKLISHIALAFSLLTLAKYMPAKTQPTFTCSKLAIETLEQGVKYVQS